MLGRKNPPDSTYDFLSDPTGLPSEFKGWLRNWLLNQPATTTGTAVALPTGNAGGDLAGSTYPSPVLKASGVTAATYGDATHVGQVAVNAKGLITAASSVAITFPSSGYATVQDEGTPLTQRATIDFAGAGVTATDDSGNSRTLVTIPGGGGSGALTQICDLTLGASQANFDTNTILGGAISGAYSHLKLVLVLRSDLAASVNDQGMMRFNNDSAGNYDYEANRGLGGTASAFEVFGLSSGKVLTHTALSAGANLFGSAEVIIPNYAGTIANKTWIANYQAKWGTSTGNMETGFFGGNWRNNVAITRIQILPLTASNWIAGSRFTLYGIT